MSTTTPTQSLVLSPLASPALYRMTVDEFDRVADFLTSDHVELIDGYIVWREDMKPSHVLVTERLKRRIETLLPSGWFVREDKPVRIPDHDEPRPDVAVVRGDPELYAARHPGPSDVALLIEVSDSSLSRDRAEKMIIYARSGIPNYWIANLIDRQIEIYADPQLSGYASRLDLKVGETAPVSIDGIQVGTIAVADLLR